MGSMVGASVVRKEDPALLTGRGTFVDDIRLPGTVHMVFVRSYLAHARIVSIETDEAARLPGVLGVWTHADLEGLPATRSVPGMERPCLATGKVHFVGEPVAVVVATDRYLAADAAEAVVVEYEELPVMASIAAATAEGATPIIDGLPSNVVLEQQLSATDAEAELAAAPHRLAVALVNQRCAAVPMEPTVCLSDWQSSGLTIWGTSQTPHHMRNEIAQMFGLSQQEVRFVAPDVGGGFGAKASFYPEFLLTAELSRRLRRPVKYVETRSENMTSMVHGRAQQHDVEVGFDDEGRLLALRVRITQDCGGWPDATGIGLPTLTSFMSGGCYRIPTIAPSFRSVVTNTTPVGSYRGAGRPEASYMIERVVDHVAAELGMDPLEVRRANFIQPGEMPYATQFEGIVYDEADFPGCLDKLLEHVDYEALRTEQAALRDDPQAPLLGIGFSTFVEMGGFGPTPLFEQFGYVGGWESANVRLNVDGSAVIKVGTSPHGQGHQTAFAQIVADQLSVPFERITLIHGDTATVQEGIGTMGSRGVPVGGSAVFKAANKVRDKAIRIAAHMLEADESDIELADGRFSVRGAPQQGVDMAEVAVRAFKPHLLPDGFDLGLDETAFHEPSNLSYPSGAHCCVVEIDRGTGKVRIRRYVAVDDCGTVINPLMAKGQIHGGVAQGIAQALIEEVTYGADGQPGAGTLVDYTLPSSKDLPRYETDHVVTPTSFNPLGAKGLGESGATAAPQAVVNAVVDAMGHLGVRTIDMPCTPQKVWRVLNTALASSGSAHQNGS
ncbi:xanthine dehydrogenase family protein molybdopterin-binding subunit [Pseudonocardia sp. KRD-184]|uniref:Xanthine dehydrogenase family protein molybdopterin-binding subunit n=1 Tax=Pseudonocardia oceani TaxID=2792013 RepID=A0ABS6U1V4_9PSEU|nr:xanthine dehydrogenase family protein molybdopterin-binding subunit [Pseudonocardia oceani]MBW0089414.1 xanthine dehydrogenase family protein molybdopterin-binding subunit [Pseudonocardia oceani]MBW0096420.1 xanthine dehydrogenase family protein molybdopterin-binding subunit [Pseudonocardia oceani]MBW0109130.1 xanthine dehydrogenase family protein molybdopterin-binding subunit [Pseudonocardia oceani]MBW0122421.1 xanthine dehydrogenase family protein molybdopterin-binding subunit [Pseudonocar